MEGCHVRYKSTKFSNQKVEVDGKSFDHCDFEHCMIIVETGETALSGCTFKNCHLMLKGNAYTIGKIIKLFTRESPLKVMDFDEPLFEKTPHHHAGEGGQERTPQGDEE